MSCRSKYVEITTGMYAEKIGRAQSALRIVCELRLFIASVADGKWKD